MVKVSITSEKITPFGGIFHVREHFMNTGQLVAGASYDLDFDHQFIETEKYDAKMTYKKFTGYSPGVPAKWIRTARHYQLNIYTDNKSYQKPFAFTDG